MDDECQKGGTTHKVDEPHNTKHHTAKPVSFLPLTNPMPSYTHPCAISPHTDLIKCHHHSFNHKQGEGRRTDGGTKEQVDTTTKARQHNGHLHGWLGVEPSVNTHGHHNQHHHTSTAKACGSPPTPTTTTQQPPTMVTTLNHNHGVVFLSCVCVSQMASDWLHGHTLATSNNTPPMPHPHREREAWMEQERQWMGEGVVIEWKWLAKTSESQAPQQTHHSSNSHQVIHANPQACYTTTKSHSSHTHTPSGGKQEDRGGTRPACHNKVKHQQPWSFAITHTGSATIKPASPKGTWCWCLWQGSCHSLTHHKGVVSHG